MLRKVALIAATTLSLAGAGFAQKAPKTTTNTNTIAASATAREHAEIMAFGQSIIEAYCRRDCDFVWSRLGSSLRSIESGQEFTKTPDLKNEFCSENPLRTDIAVSYQMYQQNYAPRVMTQAEFAQKYPQVQELLKLQPTDFLFDGAQPKQAGATSIFRASDMARFIVRKQNGAWTIIAM